MHRAFRRTLLFFQILWLAACAPAAIAPSATTAPTAEPPTFTPNPTFTQAPLPTATARFQLDHENKSVVFDFTARVCEAEWMNGGEKGLPCPGDINDPAHGYAGLLSGSDQGLDPAFAMLMMLPAQPSSGYAAIFGRFPKFTVGPTDEFRAAFTCRSDAPCDVQFNLAIYDANGKYSEPFPLIHYKQGQPPVNLIQPLSALSGQTVEFVLALRTNGDAAAAWGLWIAPRILRP